MCKHPCAPPESVAPAFLLLVVYAVVFYLAAGGKGQECAHNLADVQGFVQSP